MVIPHPNAATLIVRPTSHSATKFPIKLHQKKEFYL